MMTYDSFGKEIAPAAQMDPVSGANPAAAGTGTISITDPSHSSTISPAAAPAVPADIIPAMLPHPTTLGAGLSRGMRYVHHFERELIHDGERFWDYLSEQGQKVLAEIMLEQRAEKEAQEAARIAHRQSTEEGIAAKQQREREEIAAAAKAQAEAVEKANAEAAEKAKAAAAAAAAAAGQ